jgi:hypothetical protein
MHKTFDCNREKQSESNPTTAPATPPERTEATQLESSFPTNPITPAEYIFRSAMVSQPQMSPYKTVEVGLSMREQFAASKRDRFAASSSGRSLMSMGCSGRSLLSMDLTLRSQDFEGGLEALMYSDDFNDLDDAEDELPPDFKTLRDVSLRDLGAGKTDMMTNEYVEPLASLPEDQEHKPCPVLNLTARLERVSTCENVDLLNEKFRVTSRDWGMPVQQTDHFPEPPTSPTKHSDRTKLVVIGMGPAGGIKYSNANVASVNIAGKNSSSTQPSAVNLGHEEYGISCQASERQVDFLPSSTDKITPTSPASSIKSKTTRPRRVIDTSCSVQPTDGDVLLGRGGFTNSHPGNIRFRDTALELRSVYEKSDKEQKFQISKMLLESVTSHGNRFLERGDDGLWHEVVGDGARKKASQALRERIKGSRKITAS